MSFYPLIEGFIALTNMLGVELQGVGSIHGQSDGVAQGHGVQVSSKFKLREVHRENQRRHEKCSVDRHAFDADDG